MQATERVQRALDDNGLTCRVVELPASTRTAVEAAATIECDVAQIAKSIGRSTQSEWRRVAAGVRM